LRLFYERRRWVVELQEKTDSRFPANVSFLRDEVPVTSAVLRDTDKWARFMSAINYNKGEKKLKATLDKGFENNHTVALNIPYSSTVSLRFLKHVIPLTISPIP